MGISKEGENVDVKGSLFLVDPNPPGMGMIPPEDMFIYVKFSASPRSRITYGGTDPQTNKNTFFTSGTDEVDFISTKIKYNPSGELDPNPQKTYSTTSWTNIGGLGSTESKGVLEGFGIKSIDIKYNASLVPVVDITFTDVRGAGLFDTIKDNDRQSPYSVFFKMPYPVFNLSVKGYFGLPIDYCLHMVNWTSNFDGTTGNFDISANFIGFQQAFLNDMNIGNIIGTVNTQRGLNNLNDIFDEQEANVAELESSLGGEDALAILQGEKDNSVRKIDDFFTKIAKLQIETEIYKSNTDELDKLKDIKSLLSLLQQLKTFIGSPIGTVPDLDGDGKISKSEKAESISLKKLTPSGKSDFDSGIYLLQKNNPKRIKTSPIKDGTLELDGNYLSIRDYLLINSIQEASFITYINTLNDLVTTYSDYATNLSSVIGVEDNSAAMVNSFNFGSDKDQNWKNFIVDVNPDDGTSNKTEKLSTVLTNMVNVDNVLYLQNNWGNLDNNIFFEIETFQKQNFYKKEKGLTKDTNVYVVDFREQRARVDALIQELDLLAREETKVAQKTLNDEILKNFTSELGFKPTISSCFRIISNNTQAMTSTIYDISNDASDPNKGSARSESLLGIATDIPLEITDPVAWPLVYRNNDDGTQEEFYLGDKSITLAEGAFPEVEFVEEVFKNLVSKTETLDEISKASALKGGIDTDNWFPINPIDYSVNPWIESTVLNDTPEMDDFIVKSVFSRVAVISNYSRWSSNNRSVSNLAGLDGISANKTFFDGEARSIYGNKMKEFKANPANFIQASKFFKDNLKFDGSNFIWKTTSPLNFGGTNIGGTDTSDVIDYILFDVDGITYNTKKLSDEVLTNTRYTSIKGQYLEPKTENYYREELDHSNIMTKISYNVWDKKVSEKLKGELNNKYFNFVIGSLISDIDLSGTTADDGLGTFLNRTNFSDGESDCDPPKFLIQSEYYKKQNNYAKALLLLSTLPFKTFKDAVLDVAFPSGKTDAKIINLPKYYIYFIGGYLWKASGGVIDWNIDENGCSFSKYQTLPSEYLSKVGYLSTVDGDVKKPLEPELLNMPENTKNLFINKFKNWVDGASFGAGSSSGFEYDMKIYRNSPPSSPDIVATSAADIKKVLLETVNMIVLAPAVFDADKGVPEKLTASLSNIQNYVNNFNITYDNVQEGRVVNGKDNSEEESDNKSTNIIKLQIYNYFKNINDKWVSDTKKCFNVCGSGSGEQSLFDYFKFVDRGWNNIGDKATINLNSFLTLGSNLQNSVYYFMGKLLRDSNFLFQILPTYINFTDPKEISKMFKTVTTLKNNKSTGPIYCCIYVGGASQALDIGEKNKYQFANDGFSLDNPTTDITNTGGNTLVGFRVGFGSENQTIFKNVSLNQQEHKETGEYFKALSDLVDKRGGTQKVYQGTDLLRLFKTRSYTCKVDALGCMNIQPLMYFNLENVPFFNGAYLITSVNHSISPNHMTTNFQGVRQSKYISKPNEDILADLNLDLNETNKLPPFKFTNLAATNPIYKIGVSDPTGGFDFETKWKESNFKEMGVIWANVLPPGADPQYELDKVKILIKRAGIINNTQVCMFVANIMSQSDYLSLSGLSWKLNNNMERVVFKDTIYKDQTRSYGENPPSVDNPFYGELKSADGTIYGSTPTFTGTVESNFAWKTKTPTKYENEVERYDALIAKKKTTIANGKKGVNESGYISPKEVKRTTEAIDKQIASGFTYFNIYPGDGFRFKPRGFLWLTGRKEYYNYSKTSVLTTDNYLTNPEKVNSNFEENFKTAIYVWKNRLPKKPELQKKYKSAYEIAGDILPAPSTLKEPTGTASVFSSIHNFIIPEDPPEKAFNYFESVLLAFNLKDNDNP
jgi:predicted chitinase